MSKIVRILSSLDPLEGYYDRVDEINNSEDKDEDDTLQTSILVTSENLNDSSFKKFDSKRAKIEINLSKVFQY